MAFPVLTSFYAALLALLFAGLSAWVVGGRVVFRIYHGNGGNQKLDRRIRAHGNFAEYVPLILVLVALLETAGGNPLVVQGLLLPLLIARILHPIGMVAPESSWTQYLCRGASATVTWLILIAAALLLLGRLS